MPKTITLSARIIHIPWKKSALSDLIPCILPRRFCHNKNTGLNRYSYVDLEDGNEEKRSEEIKNQNSTGKRSGDTKEILPYISADGEQKS